MKLVEINNKWYEVVGKKLIPTFYSKEEVQELLEISIAESMSGLSNKELLNKFAILSVRRAQLDCLKKEEQVWRVLYKMILNRMS